MKHFFSFLLALSLLFSALPAALAAEEATASGEFVITPLSFPLLQNEFKVRKPEDNIGSVSLIKPSPGMKSQAVARENDMNLTFFLYDSGSSNTYFTVKIYEGSHASGKPVLEASGQFPGEKGFYVTQLRWDVFTCKSRTYLVVMESATKSGDKYVPISGTRNQEKVYVEEYEICLEKMTPIDPDTRKLVKKVGIRADEVGYVEIAMTPTKNTHDREFTLEITGEAVEVENLGGLLAFVPKDFGWSSVKISTYYPHITASIVIEAEVCINKGGHINQQSYPVASVEKDLEGVTLRYCPDCGSSTLDIAECGEAVFAKLNDVPQTEWYYESVKAAVEGGLFNGVSRHNFNPEDSMTRAMLVTVLWRYAGQPTAGKSNFKDVPEGQWYTQAVTWAAEKGIVGGVGNERFDPDGKVTREQMAAILHRYAKQNSLDMTAPAETLQSFPDLPNVSEYAVEPLQWAVHQGIISGTKEGGNLLLDPQGSATRAQVSAILIRFIDKYYPKSCLSPDKKTAEKFGTVNLLDWAFYSDGTLMVGGTATMPSFGGQYNHPDCPWVELKDRVTRVVVMEGVRNIGEDAFREMENLTEVVLPTSLRFIEPGAFAYCTALEKITIPQGTRHLGNRVFQNCSSLKEVSLPNSIYYKKVQYSYDYDAAFLFAQCSALEFVSIPIAMTFVPECMFLDCSSLKEVNFGLAHEVVYRSAFSNCSSLEKVVLPLSVKCLFDRAFSDCTNLKELVIPNPMATVRDGIGGEYEEPFGIRGTVTVYAYSFTQVAEVAKAEGYDFVALDP